MKGIFLGMSSSNIIPIMFLNGAFLNNLLHLYKSQWTKKCNDASFTELELGKFKTQHDSCFLLHED